MAKVLLFPPGAGPAPDREPEPLCREPEPLCREPEPLCREPEPLWRESLGRNLRATRERQGGRLIDVAERAGISPQYLSEVERGRKEPSSEMIAAISGALGVRLPDLLTGIAGDIRRGRPGRRPADPVLMAA